jgi:hypothetical protein
MSATATYAAHPLADLIPAMSDDEYARLREDIATNGLLDAITLYDGQVLDGRHRLRACEETGTEPRFTEYEDDSPAQFVLSHNVARRHLSVSQRAMIATDFLPQLEAEAAERQKRLGRERGGQPSVDSSTQGPPPGPRHAGQPARAAEDAGNAIGVSGSYVARAKRVAQNDPNLAQKVRAGDVTVSAAEDIVKAKLNGQKSQKLETGAVRPAVIRRVAEQAEGLSHAIGTLALRKSCDRMTDNERSQALDSCKAGLKALNAMAKALGR